MAALRRLLLRGARVDVFNGRYVVGWEGGGVGGCVCNLFFTLVSMTVFATYSTSRKASRKGSNATHMALCGCATRRPCSTSYSTCVHMMTGDTAARTCTLTRGISRGRTGVTGVNRSNCTSCIMDGKGGLRGVGKTSIRRRIFRGLPTKRGTIAMITMNGKKGFTDSIVFDDMA